MRGLYAISRDGTLKWIFHKNQGFISSPAIASNSTLYVMGMDKKLYAIKPNGEEKWAVTIGDYCDCAPSIDRNGVIYICTTEFAPSYARPRKGGWHSLCYRTQWRNEMEASHQVEDYWYELLTPNWLGRYNLCKPYGRVHLRH